MILVIAVAYESGEHGERLLASHAARAADGDDIELVIVDNSAVATMPLGNRGANARVLHFADNPGYVGGARRALSTLVGERGAPLPYRAVVLMNADIEMDWVGLDRVVDEAQGHVGDRRWVLAPRVIEPGRRFEPNPAGFRSTGSRLRRVPMRRSYLFFALYWWLSQQRRRFTENSAADSPRWTPMYRCYGACMVFGSGYFAAGGVFHDAPLFNEEEAFARIAESVDVPILFEPTLVVHHQPGLTYAGRRGVYRRRYRWHRDAEAFYAGWRPDHVTGSMATWFEG